MLYTYQDFVKEPDTKTAITNAINNHRNSKDYKIAKSADAYDTMHNELIMNYVQKIFSLTGTPLEDFTASNNKLCSNFFHRLNTQRCTYLLGNGVSFTDNVEKEINEDGVEVSIDTTKEMLGNKFDTVLKSIGYYALIHKVAFGFWNFDSLHMFKFTEFVPLWDEDTGALRAGIRFWQIDEHKPMIAVLYEEDGYSKWRAEENTLEFAQMEEKKAYTQIVAKSEDDGEEVVGEENYGVLPIIPLWGNAMHQSTLVGMKEKIDSFDLIRSGFANDLSDCSQVYWIVENAMGMSDAELERFRDRLKTMHIAKVDTLNSKATPYTQEIPFAARKEYLDEIRAGIYEDFGGLDVHTIAAGATNDHIDAAYQPMDEEADDFEYQVIEFIQQLLTIIGVEDTPVFKRNRISNQAEQTTMVLSAADYLDDETVVKKLPFISVDEVAEIMAKKDQEQADRLEDEELTGGESAMNQIQDIDTSDLMSEYGEEVVGMLEDLMGEL